MDMLTDADVIYDLQLPHNTSLDSKLEIRNIMNATKISLNIGAHLFSTYTAKAFWRLLFTDPINMYIHIMSQLPSATTEQDSPYVTSMIYPVIVRLKLFRFFLTNHRTDAFADGDPTNTDISLASIDLFYGYDALTEFTDQIRLYTNLHGKRLTTRLESFLHNTISHDNDQITIGTYQSLSLPPQPTFRSNTTARGIGPRGGYDDDQDDETEDDDTNEDTDTLGGQSEESRTSRGSNQSRSSKGSRISRTRNERRIADPIRKPIRTKENLNKIQETSNVRKDVTEFIERHILQGTWTTRREDSVLTDLMTQQPTMSGQKHQMFIDQVIRGARRPTNVRKDATEFIERHILQGTWTTKRDDEVLTHLMAQQPTISGRQHQIFIDQVIRTAHRGIGPRGGYDNEPDNETSDDEVERWIADARNKEPDDETSDDESRFSQTNYKCRSAEADCTQNSQQSRMNTGNRTSRTGNERRIADAAHTRPKDRLIENSDTPVARKGITAYNQRRISQGTWTKDHRDHTMVHMKTRQPRVPSSRHQISIDQVIRTARRPTSKIDNTGLLERKRDTYHDVKGDLTELYPNDATYDHLEELTREYPTIRYDRTRTENNGGPFGPERKPFASTHKRDQIPVDKPVTISSRSAYSDTDTPAKDNRFGIRTSHQDPTHPTMVQLPRTIQELHDRQPDRDFEDSKDSRKYTSDRSFPTEHDRQPGRDFEDPRKHTSDRSFPTEHDRQPDREFDDNEDPRENNSDRRFPTEEVIGHASGQHAVPSARGYCTFYAEQQRISELSYYALPLSPHTSPIGHASEQHADHQRSSARDYYALHLPNFSHPEPVSKRLTSQKTSPNKPMAEPEMSAHTAETNRELPLLEITEPIMETHFHVQQIAEIQFTPSHVIGCCHWFSYSTPKPTIHQHMFSTLSIQTDNTEAHLDQTVHESYLIYDRQRKRKKGEELIYNSSATNLQPNKKKSLVKPKSNKKNKSVSQTSLFQGWL
jgi:hypothetical protein